MSKHMVSLNWPFTNSYASEVIEIRHRDTHNYGAELPEV